MKPRRACRGLTGALAVGLVAFALAACRPVAAPPVRPVAQPNPPATTAPPTTTTAATTTTTAPPAPGCGAVAGGAGATAAAQAADATATGRSVVALVRRPDGLHVERHLTTSPAGARALARQLRSQSGVVAADVDQPVHVQDTPGPDPLRPQQWGLDRIPYEATWTATPGGDGTGVTVAVVDTGVRRTHQDLDDGRVLAGCDFSDPNGGDGGNDQNGHGTFVAGIIAAASGNSVGISGAAPGVHVLPVRVLDSTGSGYYSQIVDGITWATDHGANVINLSLGGIDDLSILQDAVQYAVDHGVSVVMAAGNCAQGSTDPRCGYTDDPPIYPAAYSTAIPGAIAVGATTSTDAVAWFSNYGPYVDLAAPGLAITSTWGLGDTQYATLSGTSFATPYASAAAAILHEVCPSDTPAQLRTRLESTAGDLGIPGRDDDFGAGLVRPDLAVAAC